jgi:hypothetical protein
MRRRKRFTIKLVALGLATAALTAPPAAARLDESTGVPKQSEPTLVVSPDDRSFNRMSPGTVSQTGVVSEDNGFDLGTLGVTGIVLALGAGVVLMTVYEARKHKLAGV